MKSYDLRKIKAIIGIKFNEDESSIGAVNVCNTCIVQIELLKIVLIWIGVDFAETRVRDDIFFVTEKTKVNKEIKKTTKEFL